MKGTSLTSLFFSLKSCADVRTESSIKILSSSRHPPPLKCQNQESRNTGFQVVLGFYSSERVGRTLSRSRNFLEGVVLWLRNTRGTNIIDTLQIKSQTKILSSHLFSLTLLLGLQPEKQTFFWSHQVKKTLPAVSSYSTIHETYLTFLLVTFTCNSGWIINNSLQKNWLNSKELQLWASFFLSFLFVFCFFLTSASCLLDTCRIAPPVCGPRSQKVGKKQFGLFRIPF